MISDDYKKQIRQTREGWADWGSSAAKNQSPFLRYVNRDKNIHDILDFGAGTGSFGKFVRDAQAGGILRKDVTVHEYDPSVEFISKLPERRFDLIVSNDVMEHVEPEYVDETIKWQLAHSWRQYHHIDCNETRDRLPDGRDVHLTVRPPHWWLEKYTSRPDWQLMEYHVHNRRRRKVFPRVSTTIITEYSP